jgi:hypothetical protein
MGWLIALGAVLMLMLGCIYLAARTTFVMAAKRTGRGHQMQMFADQQLEQLCLDCGTLCPDEEGRPCRCCWAETYVPEHSSSGSA